MTLTSDSQPSMKTLRRDFCTMGTDITTLDLDLFPRMTPAMGKFVKSFFRFYVIISRYFYLNTLSLMFERENKKFA